MKITYIVGTFPKLSETFILNQITDLIEHGHDVEIISASRVPENIVHEDIIKYNLVQRTNYLVRNQTTLGFELNEKIISSLFFTDLIHAHFAALPAEFALKISKAFGIPYVFTAHAYDIFISPDVKLLREKFDSASKVITISDFNKNYLLNLLGQDLKNKIQIVRCGVRFENFRYVERQPKEILRILLVGRFVEKKGICYAIEAFKEVSSEYHNIELRIIGDGELKNEIVNLITSLDLQEKVLLLGPRTQSEVIKEMEMADIFMLPSVTAASGDREGVPVTIMEASATGLPVVSTLHSGIPEVVLDGQTGFLVPERDINALAQSLKKLISDPKLRSEMGKQGHAYVAKLYNHQNEMRKLEELFKKLSNKNPSFNDISQAHMGLLRKRVQDFTTHLIEFRGDQIKRLDMIADRFEKLRNRDDELKKTNDNIHSLFDELKQKNDHIQSLYDELKQKNDNIRNLNIELESICNEKNKERQSFDDECKKIREAYLNSLSWRIAAPLRKLNSILGLSKRIVATLSTNGFKSRNIPPLSKMISILIKFKKYLSTSQTRENDRMQPASPDASDLISRKKLKRVLYALNSFPKLSETFVLNEMVELTKRGIQVDIITPTNPGESVVNEDVIKYKFLERTKYIRHGSPKISLSREDILKHYKDIDLVHSHFAAEGAELGSQVASIIGCPFTFIAHAYEIFQFLNVEKLTKLMLAASAIITPSLYNKNYLREKTGLTKNIHIVRATIDPGKFNKRGFPNKNLQGNTIITIGRLFEKKGIAYLIKAMKKVSESYPDTHLMVVGSGPLEGELMKLAKDLSLEKNVSFLGDRSNEECSELLSQSDLSVLACIIADDGDRDVCPLTLQEAMAMEVPVISTNVASIPELIDDGINGIIVPYKDENALAEAIIKLLGNSDLRKRLGEGGREKILDEFNIGKQVTELVRIWEMILNKKVLENTQTRIKELSRSYKHKTVLPPMDKQFKNRFFQNDYSEIEEKATAWAAEPNLKVSIIVASYNQKTTLRLNLLAWNHQTYPLDLIEVIVADDGSSDGTEEMINDLRDELQYRLKFYTQEDLGFRLAKVRNEGVALSEGDVIFLVDSDTIPTPEYVWEHMKYYHVSNEVAVVGSRHRIEGDFNDLDVSDIRNVESLRDLPIVKDKGVPEEVRLWRKNILFNNVAFRKQNNAWGGFHGTLVSCRKCDYIGIGGSDESFKAYGQEDTEIAFRLLSKVRYLVSNPRARLFHIEHPYNDAMSNPVNQKLLEQKMTRPKVTVYIITYNAARDIEKSITSVIEQTLQDFELIIVNDGSSDETTQLLERYRYHPKIRLFNQPYKGKAAASNVAILYARGEYICPLSQGDTLTPEALEVLSGALDQDADTGFVYAGHYQIDNGSQIPMKLKPYVPGSLLTEKFLTETMMWKKSKFILTEGFNENILYYTNYDIALKLEEVCKVKLLNVMPYIHKVTNDSNAVSDDYGELMIIISESLKRRNIKLTH